MTINEIRDSSWAEREEAVPEQAGKRQVRIGLFVLGGLIATSVLLFWLTDPSIFRGPLPDHDDRRQRDGTPHG